MASSEETDDKDLLEKFLLAVAKNLTVEMSLVKNTILAFESESKRKKSKDGFFVCGFCYKESQHLEIITAIRISIRGNIVEVLPG